MSNLTLTLSAYIDCAIDEDERHHEVEDIEEAAPIAKRYETDGRVFDECGNLCGYVKADGSWSAT